MGKAPVVAKIGREVGWEAVWDAALSGGGDDGCSIRRMQQIVGALCHHCLGDPSTCACLSLKSHSPEETLRQFELSDCFCLFLCICFFTSYTCCNVPPLGLFELLTFDF